MYHWQCLRFLNAIIFSFVYIHEGMTCGPVCRNVLRNSLFEFQGESQGRAKAPDTTHTFCIAMLDRVNLSSSKRLSTENVSKIGMCRHSVQVNVYLLESLCLSFTHSTSPYLGLQKK